jgi:dienelactone hydrolase
MRTALSVLIILVGLSKADAAMRTEETEYRHGNTVLRGFIAYDDRHAGKRPGVLIVHEWFGHNPYVRKRAEQLAQLGYVAFALDMYGKGVLARSVQEAGTMSGKFKNDRNLMRARARAGLDVLRKHERVDAAKVAAIGYCFGGTTALELARAGAPLAGVVSFHGDLATPMPAQRGQVKAKILACHGADDPFVPLQQVNDFEEEMRKAGVDWQVISYGGTVHSFTNPEADSFKIPGASYNATADRRSWEAMKDFFHEIFAANPNMVGDEE